MGLNWPNTNHNYVPAYQQSGVPFVTSSVVDQCTTNAAGVVRVRFPYVTRWVIINTTGQTGGLRVGFSEFGVQGPFAATACGAYHVTGTNANYFVIPKDTTSQRLEIKCREMWFRGHDNSSGFSLMAGYTNIPTNQFLILTGASGSNFQGVG